MSEPSHAKQAEIDSLKAEVQELREMERRLRDGVKMGIGLLVGVSALLVAFAWYAGHRTYQNDKEAITAQLEKSNQERYALFNSQLEGVLNAKYGDREQAMDINLKNLRQELLAAVSGLSTSTATNFNQQNIDMTRKIALMADIVETRHSQAFGLVYFERAIQTLNRKYTAVATEYFISASAAFLKSNDEKNLNTCLGNMIRYCFPALRKTDFATHPAIGQNLEKFLLDLERANAQGKHGVAIRDLKRLYSEALGRN